MDIKEILHKSPSKRLFRNVIHSLPRPADARGSADIIYHMLLASKSRSRRILNTNG